MLHILNKLLTKRDFRSVLAGKDLGGWHLHGQFRGVLLDKDGNPIDERVADNLIVNAGFDLIADSLGAGSRPSVISHIGVGTSSTAPSAGQTALVTQLGSRVAASYAHTGGTKVFTMSATFNPGASTGALVEAGVFNASTAGSMLDRVTFSVVNKGANDTLTTTFTFTMT